MTIACVVNANKVGGTERVATALASGWGRRGDEVVLVETSRMDDKAFYVLDPVVSSLSLGLGTTSTGLSAAVSNNVGRVRALRRVLRDMRPDVVVSFLTEQNVVTILACIGLNTGLVVSERTDPETAEKPRVWRVLRWLTYRFADRVVVLNERARKYFARSAVPVVIPNPVQLPVNLSENQRARTIIGMGRLVASKKFDVLLRAFALLSSRHSSWRLIIIGEGPESESLKLLARRLGIWERVEFRGSLREPETELGQASVFVSCSVLEGFPMAICEAMASGTPVVVALYNDSATEIVEDGKNGLLVPREDEYATAGAIVRLIEDPDLRLRLGRNGQEYMKRYAPDIIVENWRRMFLDIATHRKGRVRNNRSLNTIW